MCHTHRNGFLPSGGGGCQACHGFPPQVNAAGGPDGYAVGYGPVFDESLSPHKIHASKDYYGLGCQHCHAKSNITHLDGNFQDVVFNNFNSEGAYDIENYMKTFFDEYDAIDPQDHSSVSPHIFKNIIDFYTEKYGGVNWDDYACHEWYAVIPQELWEQVVRGRKKFQERLVPIKIQLHGTGELVDPYED